MHGHVSYTADDDDDNGDATGECWWDLDSMLGRLEDNRVGAEAICVAHGRVRPSSANAYRLLLLIHIGKTRTHIHTHTPRRAPCFWMKATRPRQHTVHISTL